MFLKRAFDFLASSLGILVLSPLFLVLAICIRLDSPGPVFFRQERVGMAGKKFRIFKFRTMYVDAEKRGLQITVGVDPRISRVGRFLRKYKLDELPQLLNVFQGTMSLVGPRPEVPRYVAIYSPEVYQKVFSMRPGITDLASIEFRNENELLSNASDPDLVYRTEILPKKLSFCLDYVQSRTFLGDIYIIFRTIAAILR